MADKFEILFLYSRRKGGDTLTLETRIVPVSFTSKRYVDLGSLTEESISCLIAFLCTVLTLDWAGPPIY